jgi:hypothetical protein
MAKVAIVLTGCSYGMRNDTRTLKTDWNQSKHLIKSQVIDCFVNQGHEVDIYLTTYFSDETQNLIDFYKPKKVTLLNFVGSQQRATYISSMNALLNENVDIIVATRFDIAFNNPVSTLNIDFDKFNFLARLDKLRYWEDAKYVDDNLFVFPKKHLQNFINALQEISIYHHPDAALHPLYLPMCNLIGEQNVHFMLDAKSTAISGDYYNLVRVCYCPKLKEQCDCWLDAFRWQNDGN